MKKQVTDGWHNVYGREVYVENGKVTRGLSLDKTKTVYPYRKGKSGYDLDQSMSLSAYRNGVNRETVKMF